MMERGRLARARERAGTPAFPAIFRGIIHERRPVTSGGMKIRRVFPRATVWRGDQLERFLERGRANLEIGVPRTRAKYLAIC